MTISLTSEQQAKLNAYVAHGDFASIEEAARQLIDKRIAERNLEESDGLAWAQPYVDEAVEEVARGNVTSHKEYRARIDTNFAKSKG